MSSKVSDKDVLQLFANLKNAENNYPQDLIESRRNTFAKQAAAMAILAKASGSGGAASTATGQAASTASSSAAGIGGASMGTILETALIVAIVAEAGVAAYAYRERISQFFKSTFGPKVEQVANPPDNSSSELTTNDEETAETPVETPTGTGTETPVPPEFVNPGSVDENNNSGDTQVSSTPAPTDDNNGLHLGQTKQPTNESKKNESNDSKDKDKKK